MIKWGNRSVPILLKNAEVLAHFLRETRKFTILTSSQLDYTVIDNLVTSCYERFLASPNVELPRLRQVAHSHRRSGSHCF